MKHDYKGLDEATPKFEIKYVISVGTSLQDGPPPPPRPSHQSAPFVPELLPPSTIPFNIACCSLSVPALCPPHKLVQGGIFAFFTDVSQVPLTVPGTW